MVRLIQMLEDFKKIVNNVSFKNYIKRMFIRLQEAIKLYLPDDLQFFRAFFFLDNLL